jgi:hypothetical protein
MRARFAVPLVTLAAALSACTDVPTKPAAETPSAADRNLAARSIIDAAIRTLPAKERIGAQIGVLDSGRTGESAVVLIGRRDRDPELHLFHRSGVAWLPVALLRTEPRAPSSDDAQSYTLTRRLVEFLSYNGLWYEMASGWYEPRSGYFVCNQCLWSQPGTEKALRWVGDDARWWKGAYGGDTLFRFDYEHFEWGGTYEPWYGETDPSCEIYSGSSWAREVDITNGSCDANWASVFYWMVADRIQYPLSATISGPSTISLGTHTWTANASGAIGSYNYAWQLSTNAGSTWSAICADSSSCSVVVPQSGHPNFRIRVTVSSSMENPNNSGTYYAVSVTPFTDVTVRPPLTASIIGPTLVRTNCYNEWYANHNGTGPFTYQWIGPISGTNGWVGGYVNRPGVFRLTVTDGTGRVGKAELWVETRTWGSCYM